MAALGGFGNSPQHINEQLMNKYLQHKFAPQPYSCKLPFRVRDGTRQVVKLLDCLIFLPTDWVATGMKTSKGTSIFGTGDIESFWREQLRNDPKFAGSTLLSNDQFCATAIPLLVHGDGGAFAERDSLLVFSMKSILSTDSVGDAQLLLAVIPKSCRVCGSGDDIGADSDTVVALWNVLSWNFTALFAGKHPELDHIGQPWPTGSERAKLAGKSLTPGGMRGFIHVLAGDMDYFSNEMGLNHHGATEPCFRCKCNKTNCPFTDFRETAAWEATKLSPADFRALAARITHAVLLLILSIPGVIFLHFTSMCFTLSTWVLRNISWAMCCSTWFNMNLLAPFRIELPSSGVSLLMLTIFWAPTPGTRLSPSSESIFVTPRPRTKVFLCCTALQLKAKSAGTWWTHCLLFARVAKPTTTRKPVF